MYGANLNFIQPEKYLRALLGKALLSFDGQSGYLTTKSGKEFLQLYKDYTRVFHSFKGGSREEHKRSPAIRKNVWSRKRSSLQLAKKCLPVPLYQKKMG